MLTQFVVHIRAVPSSDLFLFAANKLISAAVAVIGSYFQYDTKLETKFRDSMLLLIITCLPVLAWLGSRWVEPTVKLSPAPLNRKLNEEVPMANYVERQYRSNPVDPTANTIWGVCLANECSGINAESAGNKNCYYARSLIATAAAASRDRFKFVLRGRYS